MTVYRIEAGNPEGDFLAVSQTPMGNVRIVASIGDSIYILKQEIPELIRILKEMQ